MGLLNVQNHRLRQVIVYLKTPGLRLSGTFFSIPGEGQLLQLSHCPQDPDERGQRRCRCTGKIPPIITVFPVGECCYNAGHQRKCQNKSKHI